MHSSKPIDSGRNLCLDHHGYFNAAAEPAIDVKTLHAKIGELTLANDFLSGALGKAGLLPSAKR